ncbi:MAG: UDP-N-acetylglucosamine 4,6-dehydratase (inverting) [Rhodospirillaceae bacterium]
MGQYKYQGRGRAQDALGGWSLDGKSILITGGTGSFGNAMVARIIRTWKPRRLVIFSRDEMKQYEMEQRFPCATYPYLRYFIGDVRSRERLEMAMQDVDYVVHAAAIKHVPIAEYNPFECIQTNIIGAQNVVQAALHAKVKRVMALSTDKAVSPINLYGASKLAAEKVFVAANNLSGRLPTRFAIVRYGNVLGSRGSVLPLYRRLIAEGADSLPVTDERMTRFWISLPQGVDFVLSGFARMTGGEIFVPQIPSMRITDLAHALAPHLPVRVVGIRPGEKLHEALITESEAPHTFVDHASGHFVIMPSFKGWESAKPELASSALEAVAEDFSYTSNHNDQWLDAASLQSFLAEEAL